MIVFVTVTVAPVTEIVLATVRVVVVVGAVYALLKHEHALETEVAARLYLDAEAMDSKPVTAARS